MSVAEQAIADSRRILEAGLLDIFFPDAGGNVLAASNADFYNAFLNLVGGGEAYRNRDGSVRQNLSPRIRAAVLAAMLNPERRETVERLLDNPEGCNALINGLMQSAANLAELANKPEYDLSGELSQAVELFVETRDKGQTVDEFAAQTDMFREAPSAETMFLMRLFEENAKSSGGISGVLRQYAAECKKIDTTTQSLFGDENPTKLEKLEEAYRHYAADLSNEAGNGNLRWRDTGEPSVEEISEAQKQYEEVKSKYMGTPLWMKAPNGKRTNLTEEQWVRVRTPNFKRGFGNWEKEAWAKAAMDFLEKTAPVRKLSGGEFQKDGVKLTDKVPAYFKSIGNVARNDELGDVVLDLKGVEDSIAHGVGRLKSAAFMAVPDVIEKGFIFNREENWKERGWSTAVIVAPIKLGEDDYVCEVVVKKVRGQQRFYLHEVEIKRTLDGVFKSVANNGNASQVSKLILGKHLAEVKGNVSKAVDENGEPMVVYHGTPKFDRFSIFKKGSGGYLGPVIYFTNLKTYAQKYENKWGDGGNLYDVFISLRNPLVVKSINPAKEILKTIYGKDGVYDRRSQKQSYDTKILSSVDIKKLQSKGYDGVIWEYGGSKEYAVYDSSKIKSATDNIGTYSENPGIRWRLGEGAAELDARHAELYERYKGGDEAAYGEALELVADEARRNGYDVKVYHGTGADGFNVAKADASEAHYGEGAQAHGPGLYMAASRDTAEGYRKRSSRKADRNTLSNIRLKKKPLSDFINWEILVDRNQELLNIMFKEMAENPHRFNFEEYIENEDDWIKRAEDDYERAVHNQAKEALKSIEQAFKEKNIKTYDVSIRKAQGRVFDWLHNMKPDELLDEQNPNSVEKSPIGEKYKKAWYEDILPILRRAYGFDEGELDSAKRGLSYHNSAKTIVRSGELYLGADRFREIMLKHGIRGITYDGRQDGRAFVSFEGGATVKLQDPFTFDDEGNLIPLSERFDEANPDMRWKIDDDEALERIRKLSAADIEGIMDEAERVESDNLKESKGRSAARVEADREKYIRDNMSKWEEGGEEDYRYYRNPKAYEISESGGEYKVEDDDGNELDFFTELEDAKRYALERRWEDDVYDELDYKEDLYEDNPQNAMRKRFEYALRKIGIEIVNSTGGTFNGSEYIYLELPNGEEKKIRFADHPQVYSADMSVEEDWRAAFKFFVERVQREDWTEENYPDNIRWKIDDPSPERVEKLRAARPVEIGENDYKGLYELNAKSAREYVLKKLRGRKYVNADTGDEIEIGQVGARKITTHDRYNKDYLRTFAAIPQMIENAVYLGEEPNEKGSGKYDKYRYYACGLKIGGRDYTARLTIGERNGKWYYDQALTEMEKGDLIEQVSTQISMLSARGSPNGFIDNRLISLLQENNSENSSRLRYLLRQDRRENPVIWASIVLAKQILLGRAITSARLDRVLPPERFDGTKREYAVNRAREIAERYRADKEKFGNDLNLGVQRAENDLYWTRDVVEEMYASFRRDGEEYGIARQRLMEWLKEQRRRDLETVKGLSSEELGIDVPAAIEDALEKEPERRKPGKNTAEESGEETFEASGEGIDAEIESAREKPAPSSIRDIIGKIRAGVTKAAKARGMDEAARRRAYRNTLAEVLRESAKRLTYGREREAIMKKISDLSAKGYSVIKIKDGERAGQKIDNYTLRAEHIALRIFNRGVRDTKRELSEKFEKIVSRKGKKPSRMERDDKRTLAGAVQMRVYNIKRYSEMDAAELEAEYSATVDRLENVEKNFAERIRHYGAFAKAISKEIRKRAAIVQYGLPPFPASDTIQYRPLYGQSKRRKRKQKSSNPKMRCITCESDKTLARLISIKLDLSLYASAPDSYCHASLAA